MKLYFPMNIIWIELKIRTENFNKQTSEIENTKLRYPKLT